MNQMVCAPLTGWFARYPFMALGAKWFNAVTKDLSGPAWEKSAVVIRLARIGLEVFMKKRGRHRASILVRGQEKIFSRTNFGCLRSPFIDRRQL